MAGVDRVVMDYPTISGNVTTVFLDRYSESANPNGNFPRLGNGDYNSQPSSFWLKDASYLRLKTLNWAILSSKNGFVKQNWNV